MTKNRKISALLVAACFLGVFSWTIRGSSEIRYFKRISGLEFRGHMIEEVWDTSREYCICGRLVVDKECLQSLRRMDTDKRSIPLIGLRINSPVFSDLPDDRALRRIRGRHLGAIWEVVFSETNDVIWCIAVYSDYAGDAP